MVYHVPDGWDIDLSGNCYVIFRNKRKGEIVVDEYKLPVSKKVMYLVYFNGLFGEYREICETENKEKALAEAIEFAKKLNNGFEVNN